MKTSKKKTIIISSIIAVVIVGALAILIFNNIKKERELREAIKLIEQKEKEAQELKEQQEQEEKERQEQERLAKLEEGWNALAENQEYLALGSEYFSRIPQPGINGLYAFKITEEFIGTIYMIADGWYDGATVEDLSVILNSALTELPDNATGKEVYDALIDYTQMVNRSETVTGVGTNPFDILVPNNSQNTENNNDNSDSSSNSNTNNSSNDNSSNNNSSGNKNNNNTSNNNNNSTPPNNSQEEEVDYADIFQGNANAPDPDRAHTDDDFGHVDGSIGTGGN